MDKNKLFQSLFQSNVKCSSNKSKRIVQNETIKQWSGMKNSENLSEKVNFLIEKNEAYILKKKGTLMQYWSNVAKKPDPCAESVQPIASTQNENIETPHSSAHINNQKEQTIVQDQLKSKIDVVNSDILGLSTRKEHGLLSDQQEKKLEQLKKQKEKLEKQLKRKISDQERQKRYRAKKRKALGDLCATNPEFEKILKRKVIGRPRLETEQSKLLETIVKIATHGSASHERRKEDILRNVKTLSEMQAELSRQGFSLSRSGLYLRLLPKCSSSTEGKRHVKTVPVKLMRARKDAHIEHIDGKFCKTTINHLEEIASILGPNEVFFLSQDDKSRVPIGLAAANVQSPMIMHVEYRVVLPDHDWVVAPRHKLIPSVYAAIQIHKNGFGDPKVVGYSGPTFIAIRSGKHSSSTAYSHALDFQKLYKLEGFEQFTKFNSEPKPVVIITVDGGPDENPRYQKVINVAVDHFMKYNLDAIFIATNAPGRSAFNRVERRMAPLSKELSGLILPHETYGSHLDCNGKTIDKDLEKKNFDHCGRTLAEVWSNVVIDGFETFAQYVEPEAFEVNPKELVEKDAIWTAKHIRSSQYFTQIVKCGDEDCCSKPRSSLFNIVTDRFVNPPIPIQQTEDGLKIPHFEKNWYKKAPHAAYPSIFICRSLRLENLLAEGTKTFAILPYDLYCPSLYEELNRRVCAKCGIYFASIVMLNKHKQVHKQQPLATRLRPVRILYRRQREILTQLENDVIEWVDQEDLDLEGQNVDPLAESDDKTPIIEFETHFLDNWESD